MWGEVESIIEFLSLSKYLTLVVYYNIATSTKLSTATIGYLQSWGLDKVNVTFGKAFVGHT